MIGVAERLRDELWKRGWDLVEEWAADREAESIHLEFKVLEKPKDGQGGLADNTRTALVKAISGFANTDGGLLVFGVTRDGRVEGLDRARGHQPHAPGFLDGQHGQIVKLHERYGEPLPRIEIKAFKPPDGSDPRGVIAVYIAASVAPVRVAAASAHRLQGRFFLRNEHGFGEMPYTLVAAMFGRRPGPRLELEVQTVEYRAAVRWHGSVLNVGSAHCESTFARLRFEGVDEAKLQIKVVMKDAWQPVVTPPGPLIAQRLKRDLFPSDRESLFQVHLPHGGVTLEPRLVGGIYARDTRPLLIEELLPLRDGHIRLRGDEGPR